MLFRSAKDDVFRFAASGAYSFEAGYHQQTSLEFGKGYWVKYDDETSVGILGSWVTEESVAVHANWNIIGSVSAEIDAASITSDPPGLITSSFFSYGVDGYAVSALIRPGEGYWVKLSGPGTLILSAAQTYGGGTRVSAGTLKLTGAIVSPAVVDSGATFTNEGLVNSTIAKIGRAHV